MNDGQRNAEQVKRRWLGPILAALTLALPVTYVLSAGPYVYLVTRGLIDPRSPVGQIYYPLQQAQIKCPPFLRLMNRYGRMWRYEPPLPPATPQSNPAASPSAPPAP